MIAPRVTGATDSQEESRGSLAVSEIIVGPIPAEGVKPGAVNSGNHNHTQQKERRASLLRAS
jgi:hypothetical protein